MEVIF